MKIYTVDFEKVIGSYKNYVVKMLELDQLKMKHHTEMDVFRKEMENLINSSRSGLIIDENLQKQSAQRFKDLQVEASKKDNEFRTMLSEKQNSIMEVSFQEVSSIIEDYCNQVQIDLVLSKSQVVFCKSQFEITDMIIERFKSKDLYYENVLEEKEN